MGRQVPSYAEDLHCMVQEEDQVAGLREKLEGAEATAQAAEGKVTPRSEDNLCHHSWEKTRMCWSGVCPAHGKLCLQGFYGTLTRAEVIR